MCFSLEDSKVQNGWEKEERKAGKQSKARRSCLSRCPEEACSGSG
jgi:hypothetical protein